MWFLIKVGAMIFFLFWLRATLPRLRYDRLMALGWKVLLPLGLANLAITATLVVLNAEYLIPLLTLAVAGAVLLQLSLQQPELQAVRP
jgi:hypothetical protein